MNKNKLEYTGRIYKLIRSKAGLWRVKSPAVQLFQERICKQLKDQVHRATLQAKKPARKKPANWRISF